MKKQYWSQLGLKTNPFPAHLAADPFLIPHWRPYLDFLLDTQQYQRNLLLVTGSPGVGKSTLCKKISQQLAPQYNLLQLIGRSDLYPEDLLGLFVTEFHSDALNGKENAYTAAEHHLNALQATGQHYLLIIDDAETLPLATQQLCLHIIKHQALTEVCLQVILFGQPDLLNQFEKVVQQQTASFNDYIINTLPIKQFSLEEVEQYLKDRLQAAGYDRQITLFSQLDIQQIYQQSCGLPAKIATYAKLVLQAKLKPHALNRVVRNKWKLGFGGIVIVALILAFWGWHKSKLSALPTAAVTTPLVPATAGLPSTVNSAEPIPLGSRIVISGEITTLASATSLTAVPAALPAVTLQKQADSVEGREKVIINGQIMNEIANPVVDAQAATVSTAVSFEPVSTVITATQDKLTKIEEKLLKVAKETVTLQLFLSSDADKAQAFVNKYKLTALAAIYRAMHKGQPVYIVILGHFRSKEAALKYVATLDPQLQKLRPWPRIFAEVQADILTSRG